MTFEEMDEEMELLKEEIKPGVQVYITGRTSKSIDMARVESVYYRSREGLKFDDEDIIEKIRVVSLHDSPSTKMWFTPTLSVDGWRRLHQDPLGEGLCFSQREQNYDLIVRSV